MPAIVFDAADIDFLVNRFSLKELGEEVHQAELEEATSRYFEGTEFDDGSLPFWADYHLAVSLALDVARSQQPKPRPSKGMVNVEAVKAQADIVSVIEGYTRLRKSGSRYTGKCPIHHDTSPSLVVYPDKQTWHCFGACNTGGDVISFLMKADNLDFKQAVAQLGGDA